MESKYYSQLGAGKQFYDATLKSLTNRESKYRCSVDPNEAMPIFTHVLHDHPELFYVKLKARFLSGLLGKDILPEYVYSESETVQLKKQLEDTAKSLIGELINDHQSDYDKVRALHDYLKTHIQYDSEAATSRGMPDVRSTEAHSIVGALIRHKCVCEGFAKAMKYLCDKISVECWFVSGKGSSSIETGPHSWNIVRINGYYHHVDVTWDNQYSDDDGMPNYGYFNLSDDEIARDHTWDRRYYPACPDAPYSYFKVNSSLLDSKAQLENFLYTSFQNEEEYIMFRVLRDSTLEREIIGCIRECIDRASRRCRHISVKNYRYGGIQEQLTFYIQPEYSYR